MSRIYEALERAQHEAELAIEPSSGLAINKRRPLLLKTEIDGRMSAVVEGFLPHAEMKVIQFVGSRSGEGTSTIVRQFAAISSLKLHRSVLVLDADRINPVQHAFFDIDPRHSLKEAITGGGSLEKAFCRVNRPPISICLVSRNSVSPAQVLNAGGLWEILRSRFDLIFIDSPPLEVSSDALNLARNVDGVLLVVEAEKTRRPVAENLRNSIVEYGGKVLGVVLNKRRYYIPGWLYKRL